MLDLSYVQRIYTVALDYEGTSCVIQYPASSLMDALKLWVDDLSLSGMYGLSDRQRASLAKAVQDTRWKLTDSTERRNTWSVTISPDGGGMALLRIIEAVVKINPTRYEQIQ